MRNPLGLHKALPRALASAGLTGVLLAAGPAAAQVVPLDLLNRLTALEAGTNRTQSDVLALRTQATADQALLGTHTSALGTLGTDLGALRTSVATVDAGLATVTGRLDTTSAKVADIEVRLGDLRGVLDNLDVPDVIDVTGPVDVADLVQTLNRQVVATSVNASLVAAANVSIETIRERNGDQDRKLADHETRITQNTTVLAEHRTTLDDHERRITRNTDDIRSTGLAVADLQSHMTNGFADIADALDNQSRRIGKATEGVAMALAMKSPAVPEDKSFALSGSFGAFEGETALAFAGGVRATDALQFDAGLAVGLDRGSVGGRAGATLAW